MSMTITEKLSLAVRRALARGQLAADSGRAEIRRTAVGLTLGLMASTAVAQSTVGSIFGSGLEPGSTVQIESLDTGLKRTVTVDSSGRYTASSLPAGRYKVTLEKNGQVVKVEEEVGVQIGGGHEVSFTDASVLESVIVYGARPIDVSSTDTRTVFTASDLQRIPVGQTIDAVAMLAPGVIEADSRYKEEGGAASFGGSAASENAFYINGYPVTNPLTNLGSTTLPFDSIGQMQVITGGYGAEFGRATGGVVNIVTKRGTNEWTYGALSTFEPKSLQASRKNIYHPYNGTPRDGVLYMKRDEGERGEWAYGLYVGGPIVKDRLLFYVAGELRERDDVSMIGYPGGDDAHQVSDYKIPRWTATLDWNISDNHLLELSAISDIVKESVDYFPVTYSATSPQYVRSNAKSGGYEYKDGGELYVGKYTGYITESLTISALYGRHKQVHRADPLGYDPSVVYVSDSRSNTAEPIRRGTYDQLDFPDAYDETEGGRLDIEWNIGSHSLRAGYDRIDSESRAGEVTSGPGYRWIYYSCGENSEGSLIPGGGGAVCPGGNGDYVSRYIYANGGTFNVDQWAYYLVDQWQVTDRWLVSLGLRNENFRNFNADGVKYVEQTDQWAPRIGVTWDVLGDSSLKVFANAGRYHLAMPNNVARRGAAGSLYTNEYFAFDSIDPVTGVPQGLTPLGSGPYSPNQEYGQAPDPRTVAAKGLDSHFQDEFVLGFEKEISQLSLIVGARFVYRDLKSAIDDVCDWRPAYNWAIRSGYSEDTAKAIGDSLAHCRLFNPGESNTFILDDGDGGFVEVPLTAADLGFPKLKRVYQGVDMFVERPFDGLWYGRLDYTWSRNYGNAEGQLKSDVGQMDVSMTMDWDHPELMQYANGYLPNDRRHFIKAYGFVQLTPELRLSATATLRSGRPKNCTGYYPDTPENEEFNSDVAYAGPYYHFCNERPEPRSSRGRLPWTNRLDIGVAYSPSFLDNNLVLSLDVFNVFNQQVAQNIVEYGELGGAGVPYHSTNRVISYSAPRYVRFGLRYDFGGPK